MTRVLDSDFGRYLGMALLALALLGGLSLIVESCADAAAACAQAGGSYNGGNGDCELPDGAR